MSATASDPADRGLLSPAWAGLDVAALTGDAALIQALLDVESAWVGVQADASLASADDASAAAGAAEAAAYDEAELARRTPDGANVLIPLLKDYRGRVAELAGSPVAAVHRGATSQDIIDTALVLLLRRAGEGVLTDLSAAAEALAVAAQRHRDDVCIARSLTQHALPITIGHRFARWLVAVDAAREAVELQLRQLPLQWGGAVGTLASLVDFLAARGDADPTGTAQRLRGRLADRLGLPQTSVAPAWHTHRAPLTRAAAALAEVTAAAGKIAADVLILARPEVGELAEPHEEGKGGSSAMPHKRNPVLSVEIKQAALAAPAQLATLYLASGQAVDERPDGAWHAEWEALRSLLRLAGGAAARLRALAEGLQVFPKRSREVAALFGDVVLSERLSSRLAPLLDGGKKAVQELVTRSLDSGERLRDLLRAAIDPAALSDADLDRLLDPADYLGVAPTEVDAVVGHFRERKTKDAA